MISSSARTAETGNTPPEIMRAVYKAWAVNHHPDKGGDSETFKRINVAWDKIKEERGL